MKKAAIFAVLTLATAGLGMAQSTTASTNPVGFVSISVPAQTDYALGTPLQQPAAFQGQIQSISGNQIVVSGTPGWQSNQFVFGSANETTPNTTYYLQIDSGAAEGLGATITVNDSSSVTVTLNTGDSLSGVLTNAANGTGDLISIIPFWTPSTLFSGATSNIQLILFPTATPGVNLSASSVYAYNGTNWLRGLTNVNNTPLVPLQGMILRNNNSSALSLSITGSVPMAGQHQLMSTLAANTQQDIWFYFNSPVPEFIGSLNLGSAATAGDQLLVFNNAATGLNKSASQVISWNGSIWRQGLTNVTNTFQLQPGNSYILRKAGSTSPTTYVWSGLQSYLAP